MIGPPHSHGRILCVTSNLPRWQGDSTTPFVLHLAEDLQELGWGIELLAPHAPGAAKRESLSDVSVERFRYLWPESQETVCYQGGALVNIRKHPLNKLKLPSLVGAELAAVTRRLISRRYDLLHSHWILPQGFTGMLTTRVVNVPHVITVHGGDIFGLQGNIMGSFKRTALHHADAVTVNSSVTEHAVRRLAPMVKNLQRIPMGVKCGPLDELDLAQAHKIAQQYRRDQGPLLLFIGRIVEEKGVEDLLRAVANLKSDLPHTTALIIGEGQDRSQMQSLCTFLGIEDRIVFTGWVQPQDIEAYLAAADIFVGPSRRASDGWVEAQGLTFSEAMAAGTPVVASRAGGIVDTVKHEQTGLLVDERSPEQIAAAVIRLVNDPPLARRLADNAYRQTLNFFSRAVSAKAFSKLFSELIQDYR